MAAPTLACRWCGSIVFPKIELMCNNCEVALDGMYVCNNCHSPIESLISEDRWWLFWSLQKVRKVHCSRCHQFTKAERGFICPVCKKIFIGESGYYSKITCPICKTVEVEKNNQYSREPSVTPNIKDTVLSNQEVKYLIEKAKSYVDSRQFGEAVKCYDSIIVNTFPQSQYFRSRASVFGALACLNKSMEDLHKAIRDIDMAIKLDPDNAVNYWKRGVFLTYNLTIKENVPQSKRETLLREVIGAYKDSIERDPTNPQLWLDIIEINIMLGNWYDAISKYGECRSYINSKEEKLIRSWLGCIALILAGETPEEEDKESLHDNSIRLNKSHWYLGHINKLLAEISQKEGYSNRWERANEIHKTFISHFDEEPW